MGSMLFKLANILNPKDQDDYMLSSSGNKPQAKNKFDLLEPPPMAPPPIDTLLEQDDETNALDSYKTHLDTMPKRDDFKLGTGSKIASLLAGVARGFTNRDPQAGIETIHGLRDREYNQALQDWTERGRGLGERAGLEVRIGENKRKAENDRAQADLGNKEHVRKLQADLARASSQQERDRINAELAEARKNFMGVQSETMRRRETTREGMLGETRKRTGLMREGMNRSAKVPGEKPISADEQGKLEQDAVRLISSERPEFEGFVDAKTGRLKPPPRDSELYQDYELFEAIVRKRIRESRKANSASGLDVHLPANMPNVLSDIENEDDDEFEVIE